MTKIEKYLSEIERIKRKYLPRYENPEKALAEFSNSYDYNTRAISAWQIGEKGDKRSIPILKKELKKEFLGNATRTILDAIEKIEKKHERIFYGNVNLKPFADIDNFPYPHPYWIKDGAYPIWDIDTAIVYKQIRYHRLTHEYLYGIKPKKPVYKKGTRPVLEKILNSITNRNDSDKEKCVKILKWCSNTLLKAEQAFKGLKSKPGIRETEEAIIRTAGGPCNEHSRLFVTLCQIAEIPSRLIFQYSSLRYGREHVVSEVYFERKWHLMDPMPGHYYLNEKGAIASAYELRANPRLVLKPPKPRIKPELASPDFFVNFAVVYYPL